MGFKNIFSLLDNTIVEGGGDLNPTCLLKILRNVNWIKRLSAWFRKLMWQYYKKLTKKSNASILYRC